jgi:phenylacetate-CoA ligase
VRKFWFLLKEKVLGRRTMSELKLLESVQSCDPKERRSKQQIDFLAVWKRSWDSPYYRSKFKKAGLERDSIRSLGDLAKIPILTKADFRANAESMLCDNIHPGELFTTRTSGSTGQRLVFKRSRDFGSHNFAQCLRGRRWWGIQPWSTMAKFWGVAWQFEDTRAKKAKAYLKYLKDRCIGTIHFSAFDVTREDLEKVAKRVEGFRPEVLFGYGSALYMFARHCIDRGGIKHQFKVAIYTSEALTEYQRETIEKAFLCPVVSEYGAVETGIISYDCPEGKHHISEENIILEVLDKEDRHVEPGERGRAVITVLHERALPILRYDLGDILSLDSGEQACACGVNLRSLQMIAGRANDLIQSAKGSFVHPEMFDYTMRYFPGVERFRIVELDTGKIEIILQCPNEVKQRQLEKLRQDLLVRLKNEFEVSIRTTPRIENEASGKFRWVIRKG